MKFLKQKSLAMILLLFIGIGVASLNAQTSDPETTIELCPGSGETCAEGTIEVEGVKIKLVKAKGAVGAKVIIKK